jgi:transposase
LWSFLLCRDLNGRAPKKPFEGRPQWSMNFGRTVFSQLLGFLPDREFRRCVARYDGDIRLRSFSCWDQYLTMAFAQLTYRESLRDIEACLRSMHGKLYHMGFHGKVARSTLADANESRDWRIYADFAQVLIRIARPLYAHDPIGVDLDQSLYALDSTTIDLCLSLFPWARFRKHKAAVKMHTLLDLHGNIPTFIRITGGKVHDVNILDEILPEVGAFYIMDRGYIDFERLYVFTLCSAFFVVRTKENVLLQRRYSHPVDKTTGVRSDHTVILTAINSAMAYPDQLRRVSYHDAETDKRLKFLTNNFVLPALTIAQIYKSRWQVELFFKWIKQHLRIKAFYGTSDNAVKTQIWIAVSIYVLVAILRKRLGLEASLYQILQILSVTLFEKVPILQAFQTSDSETDLLQDGNQLILFDF